MKPNLTPTRFALIVALLTCTADVLHAQTVPYKASGDGAYSPVNGDYGGDGKVTHLGKHEFSGNIMTIPTAHPLIFLWVGTTPQETISSTVTRSSSAPPAWLS